MDKILEAGKGDPYIHVCLLLPNAHRTTNRFRQRSRKRRKPHMLYPAPSRQARSNGNCSKGIRQREYLTPVLFLRTGLDERRIFI